MSRRRPQSRGPRASANAGRPYSHCAFWLHSLGGGAVHLDVHRWALHASTRWNRPQRRITTAVWDRSRAREWRGVIIREMDPQDAVLVGLVLQRCWGGDRWHLKTHDMLGFRFLSERYGVDRGSLRIRARELGVSRTLEMFLGRCDPEAGRLDLAPPAREQVRRWRRATLLERGALSRSYWIERASQALPALADVVRVLPTVLHTVRLLRRGGALPTVRRHRALR